jgi:DNA-binding transcriptional LysR family regulator
MNLRNLRTFVLIAEAGGITHAADRLHLSAPAASRQIVALEQEFRVNLFDRIGRRLRLTSDGEDLLARSRRLLDDAEALGERARSLKAGQTGLLRIGAPPQVIEVLFAPFVPQYRRRYPGVDIHLIEDATGNLPTRLEQGDVHLIEIPVVDQRLPARLLFPVHAMVALPTAHRLARRATLEVAELADEPLVLQRREFQMRRWIDGAFNVAHIRPNVLFESASPHTLVAVASAGFGIAIVPSNVQIPRDGVRTTPLVLRGASIGGWSAISWHPQRFLPPYAERFLEEFVAHARRVNPGRGVVRRAPPIDPPKNDNAAR